ncbi:MAG: GntR family transcriptional regulator [Sulfobacillus thermosulfidooxidans]|nr:MAG: GntR family transcriptional regulator [Sulfobacillus thermosulfidooxidans]
MWSVRAVGTLRVLPCKTAERSKHETNKGWLMIGREYFREERRSLSEQAYLALREAIITLRLEPGQMVYESELAEVLDMSRTPIREAIRTLVADDLIEVLPQRGMKVSLISLTKVEEVRIVREVLEVDALKAGINRWNMVSDSREELPSVVESCLAWQQRAAARGDIKDFLDADEAFHRAIVMAGNNRTLQGIVTQMRAHLNRVRLLSVRKLENFYGLIDEHTALYQSIEHGDQAQALSILTHHLRRLVLDLPRVQAEFPHYFTV